MWVTDRLDSLAEHHPLVTEALLTISGGVRNTATLLEVLVAMETTPLFGLNAADAWYADSQLLDPGSGIAAWTLVVKNDVQEWAMNLQSAAGAIVDET
jgi:hypothetical protein